jgi:hypothetical protein
VVVANRGSSQIWLRPYALEHHNRFETVSLLCPSWSYMASIVAGLRPGTFTVGIGVRASRFANACLLWQPLDLAAHPLHAYRRSLRAQNLTVAAKIWTISIGLGPMIRVGFFKLKAAVLRRRREVVTLGDRDTQLDDELSSSAEPRRPTKP